MAVLHLLFDANLMMVRGFLSDIKHMLPVSFQTNFALFFSPLSFNEQM